MMSNVVGILESSNVCANAENTCVHDQTTVEICNPLRYRKFSADVVTRRVMTFWISVIDIAHFIYVLPLFFKHRYHSLVKYSCILRIRADYAGQLLCYRKWSSLTRTFVPVLYIQP